MIFIHTYINISLCMYVCVCILDINFSYRNTVVLLNKLFLFTVKALSSKTDTRS